MPGSYWNPEAHDFLKPRINRAERWFVDRGLCALEDANDMLLLRLLDKHRTNLMHTTAYVVGLERQTCSTFIVDLPSKKGDPKRTVGIADHLLQNKETYFPNFKAVLQRELLRLLRNAETIDEIARHGIVPIAVAYLPTAYDDLECEFRRRGAVWKWQVVDPEYRGRIEQKPYPNEYLQGPRLNRKTKGPQLY
jgi:hypothetical protein